ncbi:hypothetical protein Peur_044693 [Populus x canadensis]
MTLPYWVMRKMGCFSASLSSPTVYLHSNHKFGGAIQVINVGWEEDTGDLVFGRRDWEGKQKIG